MKRKIVYLCSLPFLMLALIAAAKQASFDNNKAEISFPEAVTFSVNIKHDVNIKQVVLEYGDEELTCGNVIAKAFPDFTPGKDVNITWKWDMRQSGSLPPGAKLWWRWVVTDENGNQSTSERQEIIWLDSLHDWQSIKGERINLHWYEGDQNFGKTLHTAAVDALKKLDAEAGLKIEQPVDIYIYGKTEDMRDAVLFEPGWTGGLAYAPHNIVIIGINKDILEWGKSTEAHELTHVVTGHMTFNCLSIVPTWLEEGLATYSEGKLDDSSQKQLDQAIKNDTLISLRALSGSFSEKSDKADLSYSESYSVVSFVLKTYGRAKMTSLLNSLQTGKTIDEALQQVYGMDTDGLEDAWRKAIDAKPRAVTGAATATPVPTFVPTIQPVSGIPNANVTPMATPAVSPAGTMTAAANPKASATVAGFATKDTGSPSPTPASSSSDNGFVLLAIVLAVLCGIVILLIVVVIAIVINRRKNDAQQ